MSKGSRHPSFSGEVLRSQLGERDDHVGHLCSNAVEPGVLFDPNLVHIQRSVDLDLNRVHAVARLAVMPRREAAGERLVTGDRIAKPAIVHSIVSALGARYAETIADHERRGRAQRLDQRAANRWHW